MKPGHESVAKALADAWRAGTTVPLPVAADAPANRAEAYALQDRMAEHIGGAVAGWKVGAAIAAVQFFEGHDGPLPGRVFADRLFQSSARAPSALLRGAKAECEFAFRLARDLGPADAAIGAEALAPHLVFHPAIEIAASRWQPGTGGRAATTFDGIADNGTAGAAVIGEAVPDWRGLAFDALRIEARIDGSPPIQIYGGAYRRPPLEIAAETFRDLLARGVKLPAGTVLLTGSASLPTPFRKGQKLVARFADLPPIEVTLA